MTPPERIIFQMPQLNATPVKATSSWSAERSEESLRHRKEILLHSGQASALQELGSEGTGKPKDNPNVVYDLQ
jgi:hypothetical protein